MIKPNIMDKLLDGVEVEWKPLGEVLVRTKGTKITARQMKELHKINAKLKIFAGGKTIAFVDFEDIPEKDINREPSIIVKSRGIIEFEYYDKPFSHKNEMWSYHSKNENINIKFVYYFLKINELYFQNIGSKMQMPQIATPDTDKFKVPIPPLKVQEEIVRILDTFTELSVELRAELTAELTARKKQYTYYRDKLLTFDEGEVEWKTLGEVAKIFDSLHQTPQYSDHGLNMIRVTDIKGGFLNLEDTLKVSNEIFMIFTKKYLPQKYDLVMSRVGSYGNVSIVPSDNAVCMGQNTVVIHPLINSKYLYYILLSNSVQSFIERNVGGGSQKTLSLKSIKEIPIPIVNEIEQARIVSILDKLDFLTSSITEGLPREIELRQKQYEYYRNMLLSFPKEEVEE
ncbi:restriction endonuclease subunit S [Bacillus toyonensis]|uniref:restriction endonuclease subunit S n=1 Tax=Bacillus toyonensis TaxID=155322 RepID=UPI000BFB4D58|nr:restriction endonuclease subunit S [Bacillus toyonensis]PHD44846.1 restriction endonuclease subunit S [Bacillus toyonensis]